MPLRRRLRCCRVRWPSSLSGWRPNRPLQPPVCTALNRWAQLERLSVEFPLEIREALAAPVVSFGERRSVTIVDSG